MGISVTLQTDSVLVRETGIGQGSHIEVLQKPIDMGGPVKGRAPQMWEIELSISLCASLIRAVRDMPEIQGEIVRQDAGG